MKKILSALLAGLLMLAGCSAEEPAAPAASTPEPTAEPTAEATAEPVEEVVSLLNPAQQAFIDAVDVKYSYDWAVKMEGNKDNGLGYRTAGSPSEFATGEMIAEEMKAIGLTNVTKDEFMLDGWTFKGASLTYTDAEGNEVTSDLGGYQCDLDTDGAHEYQLVYAGCGTEAELADLDVEGKIVLVDINQSADWWINYPAYEAYLNKALCVMAAQDGGYAEVDETALNAQDICGPAYMGAVSVSRKDADALIELCDASENGEVTVTFACDSHVYPDVPSYNIVGMIEGKNKDEYILMSGHYDSYFAGFQDDNCAIAIMLGIAKGLVESGYQPEKTLVFLATAAEEWGVSNTRYDWSTGAYNEVFNVHPEWAGKVIADINFELPASGGDTDTLRTSYELHNFMYSHAALIPNVEGAYENGVVCVPGSTWSDDFSLSIFGIPSSVTTAYDGFKPLYYHSQYDDRETYSEAGFTFNHYLFGTLMIAYDQCAVSPLDFTTRLNAFRESINEEILSEEQVKALNEALDSCEDAADAAAVKVMEANEAYAAAVLAGDEKAAEELHAKYAELNATVLEAFKYVHDGLLCLTWEDSPQFPHEHWTNNLENLEAAADAVEAGEIGEALDEYLWAVDNNWYAYDWSKDTFNYYTDYVLKADDKHLMWGKGKVLGQFDLYDVIHALMEKEEGADVSAEQAVLETMIKEGYEKLDECVAFEVTSLGELEAMLKKAAE